MKGVINKCIHEFVEAELGAEAWENIKKSANCDEIFFSAGDNYPDQMTVNLVDAVAKHSCLPLETVLFEFGKFWVSQAAPRIYPTLFNLGGKNAKEFLLNINQVHEQVMRNIPNSKPPEFECAELPDGRLLMRYKSERKLCAIMRGCIRGVGDYFNEEVRIKETTCMNNGHSQCAMEVAFNGS